MWGDFGTQNSLYGFVSGDYFSGVKEFKAVQLRSLHLYFAEHLFQVLLLLLKLVLELRYLLLALADVDV